MIGRGHDLLGAPRSGKGSLRVAGVGPANLILRLSNENPAIWGRCEGY